jgi:hypothetical protein
VISKANNRVGTGELNLTPRVQRGIEKHREKHADSQASAVRVDHGCKTDFGGLEAAIMLILMEYSTHLYLKVAHETRRLNAYVNFWACMFCARRCPQPAKLPMWNSRSRRQHDHYVYYQKPLMVWYYCVYLQMPLYRRRCVISLSRKILLSVIIDVYMVLWSSSQKHWQDYQNLDFLKQQQYLISKTTFEDWMRPIDTPRQWI